MGVFITLIGYPILILLCSSILTVMMFTFWAWLPVIMLLTYLFNIFIYQFESSYQYGTCFFRCFPILSVVLAFIKDILIILWALLLLCILSPLGSFFALLWVVIRQLFRITFDALILCLIGRLGRVPSHNTSMAWKISGPGMSKEYYMSIT